MSTGDEAAERGVATPPASRDEAPGAESMIDLEAKQHDNEENTPKSDKSAATSIKDEPGIASIPEAILETLDANALNTAIGDLEPLPVSLPAEDVAMLIDAIPQSAADAEQVLSADIVPLGTDAASLAADSFNFALPQPSTPIQPILPLQPHDSITPLALNNSSVPGSAHDPMMSTPFAASPLPMAEPEAPRIQAFAKLEFDDGQFYMNTYSVLLGRDIRAARIAHQTSKTDENGEDDDRDASNDAPASSKHRRVGSSRIAGSAVSESGGIIGEDDRQPKRRSRRSSRRSKSSDSASHAPLSRKNSNLPASMLNDYQSMVRPSSGNVHPVNPSALLPSPDECPLIPIHPPATGTGGHKGISRKHARIKYNFETNGFELEILGKNGVFVDDQWFPAGDTRPLHSGSYIQIGGVGVRFILPDIPVSDPVDTSLPVEDGIYGYDEDDALDVDDSVDFDDDSEDSPDNENELELDDEEDEDNEINDEEDEEDEEDDDDDDDEGLPAEPEPPKKRGPGRPPKNGISRREMAERARAEKYRLTLTLNPPKNKVGRPRKYPRPEEIPQKPEKRKYTRRNLDDKNGRAATAKKDKPGTSKPQQKRPLKPPRSPSPEFDESQLTPEQLQKPQASYVVLIYEAISNSKTGAMSLPQIYRAIERKYPFFKLRVQTNGWQSSVRHNLSQHPAFCKVERDGKGWMWGLVPDVSVEKERKRKSSPSSREPPAQYQSRPSSQYQKSGEALGQASNSRNLSMSGQSSVPPAGGQRMTGIMPAKFVNSNSQGMGGFRTANTPALGAKPPSTTPAAAGYYANSRSTPANPANQIPRQDTELALNREINKSVMAFQTKLTESLLKNGVQNAKAVVQSGVDRALGHASASTTPGGEHSQERNIMTALQSLIMQIRQKHAGQFGGKVAEPASTAAPKPTVNPSARSQEPSKSQAAQSQLLNLLTAIGKGKRVGTPPTNGNGAGKGLSPASLGQKRGIENVDSEKGELRQSKRIAVEQESSRSA